MSNTTYLILILNFLMLHFISKTNSLRINRLRPSYLSTNKLFSTNIQTSQTSPNIGQSIDNTQRFDARKHVPLNSKQNLTPVSLVTTEAEAKRAIQILSADPDVVWACDTEVADIDVKKVGPVGNGKVICVSMYGGRKVNEGKAFWVENIGKSEGILNLFKEWFENEKFKKVWHNYGFDRHVLYNEGINCRGFFGDTMHMARLWDTSLDKMSGGGEGYSLEGLTEYFFSDDPRFQKTSMKELFGVGKIKKDGEESKIKELPEDLRILQTDEKYRASWIEYSARDAVATFYLKEKLVDLLKQMDWVIDGEQRLGNMFDFYKNYLARFGELLTDMERNGIKVDTLNHLKQAEQRARRERDEMERVFRDWARVFTPHADVLNIGSPSQMGQLLFGLYEDQELISAERSFKFEKTEEELETEKAMVLSQNPYALLTTPELKPLLKERGLKASGTKADLTERLLSFDEMEKEGLLTKDEILEQINGKKIGKKVLQKEVEEKVVFELLMERVFSDSAINPSILEKSISYQKKTIKDLKIELEDKELPDKPKKKTEIVFYLLQNDFISELKNLEKTELLSICESRGLKVENEGEIEKNQIIENLLAIETENLTFLSENGMTRFSKENKDLIAEKVKTLITTRENDEKQTESESEADTAARVISAPKRHREVNITTIGLIPTDFTSGGAAQVSATVLKKLAGSNLFSEDESEIKYGTAFDFFADLAEKEQKITGTKEGSRSSAGKEAGVRACRALGALAAIGQIDATINNFLVPLQTLVDQNGRIHCSLNLNTETGRLSSRKPNLQNQPALEKDQYKIRDAFIAEEGKTLIVADYGQLELRLLAHITNCQSMIDAFLQGGCFHSRTAMGMYPYIKESVDKGEVLLEWDYSKGQPTVELVKDKYGSERRKAKVLNFSIAYGKTVHGLAQDWGITKEEAQATLNAWYRDRPEVKKWQEQTQFKAKARGYVRTMMGRYRRLPDALSEDGIGIGHAMRAAINTPIQGSAADVVMMAMLKLGESQVLKELGWKLLLQIHDEVILEGPKESKDQAMVEVINCMERPFDGKGLTSLRVHLDVDAKSADSWYKAK